MLETSNGDNLKHPQLVLFTLDWGVVYKSAAAAINFLVAVEMSDYDEKLYSMYRRQGL